MSNHKLKSWVYRSPDRISPHTLHIEVIADYGGGHSTDHAFAEVRNHFLRFDKGKKIRLVTEHPVFAFSTLETGFWISQEGLHSEHKDLVIFSNTAPRGDVVWRGHETQGFVCGILDNGIPIFAVNAGYNLSFVKDRLKGLWEVKVPNVGTQFRSRDYYPEVTMAILQGNSTKVGKEVNLREIPAVPNFVVASVDGYGNLKTTIRRSYLSDRVLSSKKVKVTINNASHIVLNTLAGGHGKVGELCMVQGSSGGKNRTYIEFIRMQGRAADDFHIDGPRDDMGKIVIETIREG
ncbi:SAM-dependent chlorinase/fluorinase [Candidatus Gottesmanbacteria bacterium]|nr:SAM-dependent chlorinase/fluorinase [Candidatus Gottesmanbacteria bacterium]